MLVFKRQLFGSMIVGAARQGDNGNELLAKTRYVHRHGTGAVEDVGGHERAVLCKGDWQIAPTTMPT